MDSFSLGQENKRRDDAKKAALPQQVRELAGLLGKLVKNERVDQSKVGWLAAVHRLLVEALEIGEEARVAASVMLKLWKLFGSKMLSIKAPIL